MWKGAAVPARKAVPLQALTRRAEMGTAAKD